MYTFVLACCRSTSKKGGNILHKDKKMGGVHIIRPNRKRGESSLLGANKGNKKEQMGRENNKGKRKEKDKDEVKYDARAADIPPLSPSLFPLFFPSPASLCLAFPPPLPVSGGNGCCTWATL